jgi:osmoprotectant transport system ATP-binding protein
MIRFENISQHYSAGQPVLRDLSFEVLRGQFVVLIGASGSGKTTTLKLINRLLEPTGGRIFIDGQNILERDPIQLRRSIGYVFQRFGLFPHLTLAENVAVGPRLLGWQRTATDARTDELLNLLGLPAAEYRTRFPGELSGGQQQRVGVARALAARPLVMLMDEPFGALDPVTRDHLQLTYRRLHDELGLTTVMITHDVTEALLLADRVLVLDQGAIVQSASPRELLSLPQADAVARLLEIPRHQLGRLEALTKSSPG